MNYFASLCEHMVATVSLLPKTLWRHFDGASMVTHGGAHFSEGQVVLRPGPGSPTPQDLSRPVRMSMLTDVTDTRGCFMAMSIQQASKAELRACRQPFLSPYPHLVLVIATLYPYRGIRGEHNRVFAGFHPREKAWVMWGQNIRHEVDAELSTKIELLISMQFSSRYDWHATMRIEGSPGVSIPTSPVHARRLFKARDLPPGKERRAAIRHWVTEHYRGKDTPHPVGVSNHFRGASEFDWSGLRCEVTPSEYDRDRVGQKPQAL